MKILIAGDMRPYGKVAQLFDAGDYEAVLSEVRPYIEQADYSVINFESPVVKGNARPIEKCGPNLKCSDSCVKALKWAGFDCVTLANNHFLDFGRKGVQDTLYACDAQGIDTVGGGMNVKDASHILYKQILGKVLAIINCCEHEFSIATEETAGSNPLNPIQQYYAIVEARKRADFIVVIVHGGHEHYQLPSPRMQETYRFFIDAGADAVVNHHQHCYSGYEWYHGKPIIYGLGNFSYYSNLPQPKGWYEGYMVVFDYSERLSFDIIPYQQSFNSPKVIVLNGELKQAFNDSLDGLNSIIIDPVKLKASHEVWMKENCASGRILFQPYNSRILRALFVRGLLPSFITKKKRLSIQNNLRCESHLDSLRFNIESKK